MPTFLRMMEVLSCSLAGFLPYILLVVYPFRNHMRLKSFLAGLLTLVMTPAVLYYDILSALGTSPTELPFPLLRAAALLALGILTIRANLGKQLLNTLSVINLSILISAVADRFAAGYTTKYLIITLVMQALLLIPYTINLVRFLAPALNTTEQLSWKLLWVAPAAGTALGCILLLSGSAALPVVMVLAMAAAAAAAFFILPKPEKEMSTLLLKKEKPAAAAVAAPAPVAAPKADLADAYLSSLRKRMAESEYSCKELLLQVMMMEQDLDNQDLEQLRSRMNAVRKQLAPEIKSTGNAAIDPVMTYYARQAMLSNIKIATGITLPEESTVTDEDMTVLISCLMDCALDACREQTTGTRRIATASYQDGDLLQIGIKNTYETALDSDCEALNICRQITARYNGKLTVLDMNGVSQIVAVLHI